MCEGWSKFGVFTAHLNFRIIALHIVVVENPGTALI